MTDKRVDSQPIESLHLGLFIQPKVVLTCLGTICGKINILTNQRPLSYQARAIVQAVLYLWQYLIGCTFRKVQNILKR